MNKTELQNFLACLSAIDDTNFLALRNVDLNTNHTSPHHASEHHEHDESTGGNGIIIAKITTMVVLFVASSICGSVPFLLNRWLKWTERQDNARSAVVVQCLLYFGGGVLLATTFLHLLPEVQEVVEGMQECEILPELAFPLAELLMCIGFFLMYLIEELLHAYINHHRKQLGMNEEGAASAAFERAHSVRNSFLIKGKNNKAAISKDRDASTDTAMTITNSENATIVDVIKSEGSLYEKQHVGCSHSSIGHTHTHAITIKDEADGILTSSLRGLFIVLALSLHELFEGMAIGLENASATAVWFMFGAVSAHKLVLAFCVGVELIVARTRLYLSIIYVFTFAVVSPLGIGIGILLSGGVADNGASPNIPSAILQGLACGTLLYVVFFEILSKSTSHTPNSGGLRTFIALIFGFALMFALQQIGAGGHHGHSHGSCHDHGHDHDDHGHDVESKHLKLNQQLQILRQASARENYEA